MAGPEKLFEKKITKLLTDRGAWVLKTWSNGVQRAGVPDLIVCYKGYFLGLEIKARGGKISELQTWNIEGIRKAGGISRVLYPDDLNDFIDFLNTLSDSIIY